MQTTSLFQFLIGRVKTFDRQFDELEDYLLFQFLIGRVKTVHQAVQSNMYLIVSIPYR